MKTIAYTVGMGKEEFELEEGVVLILSRGEAQALSKMIYKLSSLGSFSDFFRGEPSELLRNIYTVYGIKEQLKHENKTDESWHL